jgi:magnesium chelatase accessory protein
MSDRLLPGWPHREHSRFVRAGGLNWHVQVMGQGPVLLMAHGTGAATHSWRGLMPLLAAHFTVVAPDLPGHGFTDTPSALRLTLPGIGRSLQALLQVLGVVPVMAAGHSAGAAILAHMCLHGQLAPRALVSLNGAMIPLGGMAGQMLSPLAKLLAGLPLLPQMFAWRARDRSVAEKLLNGTGSRIDDEGVALYARLLRQSSHAGGALRMMAHWDLRPLVAELPKLSPSLLLIVGENDRAIPPADAEKIRRMVPGARLVTLPLLGHLAHEEDPASTADLMLGLARESGVLA